MSTAENVQNETSNVLDAIVRISKLTDSQERAIDEYGMAMLPTYQVLARQACHRHQLNPAQCVLPLVAIIAGCDRRLVERAVASPEILESLDEWVPRLRKHSTEAIADYAHASITDVDSQPFWERQRCRQALARAQQAAALRGSEPAASAELRLQPIALDDVAREAGHG